MSQQIRDQLQATLGNAYTLERELGGGGMSRVFVAEETALRRKVVVKVLPPELTAGVNVERFNREILLAAKLQHPHIVPVLAAGETQGLPYYTMPLVEGESLRARLARGPLTVTDAVSILRDVARALAYAHERGIVHRDIKPDNVLITGGSATVTDFGIAKAISAARTQASNETLTQIGTSIGTPAYMSPEQAAGDPDTNQRTDIYSFGCVAYELLAGRPPFVEQTPRKLLAAHMGEAPAAIAGLRPDVPPMLAELVMRCLAKEADDRPQAATDLVRVLETVTSSGGGAAMPSVLLGGPGMFRKALAIYAGAFVVVAIVAKAAIVGIGLPDWVFPGSLIVMALGLPVVLWTGYVHRVARRAMTMTPTFTPGGTPAMAQGTIATMALKAAPKMSWYKTARGGMYAFGAFIAVIAVFMAMRAFGIGPAGSLLGSGKLKAGEPLLVADFNVKGGADSSVGAAVAEAVRADFGQSTAIRVLPASVIASTLRLMQRAPGTRVDVMLGREVAQRAGARALVTGDLTPLGAGFIISVRLISAEKGDELASFQATANGPSDLIPTVQKLTRELRGKIGESLRAVNASGALAEVTTPSLDALKKYQEGARAYDYEGDNPKAVAALKEAIALDSGFAMAWRKLAVVYAGGGYPRELQVAAADQAYRFRDRLSDVERLNAIGYYYMNGSAPDRAKAAAAFEALQQRGIIGPHTHNLGNIYYSRREYARAESLYALNIRLGAAPFVSYNALGGALFSQGKYAQADSVWKEAIARFPNVGGAKSTLAYSALAQGHGDSALAILASLTADPNPALRLNAFNVLGQVGRTLGRIAQADQADIASSTLFARQGVKPDSLVLAMRLAQSDIWWLGQPERGVKRLDDALARTPLRSRPVENRPYWFAAALYAVAGRADKAKAVVAQYNSEVTDTAMRRTERPIRHFVQGEIALAEKRPQDAIAEFRASDSLPDGPALDDGTWLDVNLGRAFDQAGRADSAIAYFERYLTVPGGTTRFAVDAQFRAGVEKRLGELYEDKGDTAKAVQHYKAFVELWKGADPELQPQVTAARAKIRKLQPVERTTP